MMMSRVQEIARCFPEIKRQCRGAAMNPASWKHRKKGSSTTNTRFEAAKIDTTKQKHFEMFVLYLTGHSLRCA